MRWPGVPLICTCRLQENWAWFFSDMKSLPADLRNLVTEWKFLLGPAESLRLWLSEGSLRHGQLSSHRLSTGRLVGWERKVSSKCILFYFDLYLEHLSRSWSLSASSRPQIHSGMLFLQVDFRVPVLGLWEPSAWPSSRSTATSCKDAPKKPCMKLALSLFSLAAFLRKEI